MITIKPPRFSKALTHVFLLTLLVSFQNCGQFQPTHKKSEISFSSNAPLGAIVISGPGVNTASRATIALQGSCQAGASVEFSGGILPVPAVACSSLQFSQTVTLSSPDGNKTVTVTQNLPGGVISDSRVFILDTAAPMPLITQPAANSVSAGTVMLIGTCETGLNLTISGNIDATMTAPCTGGSFNTAVNLATGNGNKTVNVAQTDAAGNSGTNSRVFVRQSNGPNITITAPPANTAAKTSITLTGTCEGAQPVQISGAGVAAQMNTACSNNAFSAVVNFSNGDGAKVVNLSQANANGDVGVASRSFIRDNVAPAVLITAPAAGTQGATGLTVSGTCETGLNVTLSGADLTASVNSACNAGQFSGAVVFAGADGNKTVTATQTDSAGNAGSNSRTFAKLTPSISGAQLYAQHCQNCHGVLASSQKIGATAQRITSAINTDVPLMASLRGQLSAAQITAIAQALAIATPSPGPTPTPVPTVCSTTFAPERSPLRILTANEYNNIAADVFGSTKNVAQEAGFDTLAPGPSGFLNSAVTSDAGSTTLTSLMIEKYWNAAGNVAADLISKKAVSGGPYQRIASCATTTPISDACANTIVRNLGLQLWRRPLVETGTDNEFARLKALLTTGTFDSGLTALIRALMISPNFLTVAVVDPGTPVASQPFALNSYQLASRLSFFLWQSVPDTALFNSAQSGAISNPTEIRTQITRMLQDTKAKRLAALMASEWVGANKILSLGLTSINVATQNDLVTETTMMFEDIIKSDVSLLNMMSANYSFLNKNLADFYGVAFAGASPTTFTKTNLGTNRSGVLNQSAFLIATAGSPTASHPVRRGKVTTRSFACYDVNPPPSNLDVTPPQNLPADSTPREMLAIHTQKPACIGCHSILDPYGLALETFDPLGKFRTTYASLNNKPVITSGQLQTGETFNNTAEFMSKLTASPKVRMCLTQNVMAMGLARKVANADDLCAANNFAIGNVLPNSKFSDLVFDIVTSRQFRYQTTEAP